MSDQIKSKENPKKRDWKKDLNLSIKPLLTHPDEAPRKSEEFYSEI